jgi:hypothetical protein
MVVMSIMTTMAVVVPVRTLTVIDRPRYNWTGVVRRLRVIHRCRLSVIGRCAIADICISRPIVAGQRYSRRDAYKAADHGTISSTDRVADQPAHAAADNGADERVICLGAGCG